MDKQSQLCLCPYLPYESYFEWDRDRHYNPMFNLIARGTEMTAPRHRIPRHKIKMTTPIIAGAGVAALALTGRAAILSFEAWRRAPPRMRKFYEGGFDPEMTKREAALILGVRESAAKDKVLAAHRKVMIANHPDAGGSDYIATKINEAKAKLIKKGGSGSPF